jgi:hypothetical protein
MRKQILHEAPQQLRLVLTMTEYEIASRTEQRPVSAGLVASEQPTGNISLK